MQMEWLWGAPVLIDHFINSQYFACNTGPRMVCQTDGILFQFLPIFLGIRKQNHIGPFTVRDKVYALEGKEEKVNYFCELKGESRGVGVDMKAVEHIFRYH